MMKRVTWFAAGMAAGAAGSAYATRKVKKTARALKPSNVARGAVGRAKAKGRDVAEAVRDGKVGEVPAHLRDAHYSGAGSIGHGTGYDYPHDDPRGWVAQQYRPTELADRRYYEPSAHGFEQDVARRMAVWHEEPQEDEDDGR